MIVEKVFIISMSVMAIWATMWDKAIFEFVRHKLQSLPEKLQFPIFDCPICMCPWYGSVIYWVAWGEGIKDWLLVIIPATGLNAVLVKLFPPDEGDADY